jgi:hypothetical protein
MTAYDIGQENDTICRKCKAFDLLYRRLDIFYLLQPLVFISLSFCNHTIGEMGVTLAVLQLDDIKACHTTLDVNAITIIVEGDKHLYRMLDAYCHRF